VTTYLGVDLAWGERNRTGLMAMDAAGGVLDIAEAVTDAEVLAWLRPHARGSCLVAFDAPLIVRNATGQRQCERLTTRFFGTMHAGAHSSNLSLAPFADGGRAARIAARLALDVDPFSRADRRALEVYPHPASVMLFGLTRVLPYKRRPHRTLASRRAALLTLTAHLESLRHARPPLQLIASPAWLELVGAVRSATLPAHLNRVEDRIDAVLCAYIGRYADARPADVRVLGDARDGYILTPVDAAMAARIDAA